MLIIREVNTEDKVLEENLVYEQKKQNKIYWSGIVKLDKSGDNNGPINFPNQILKSRTEF